MNGKLWMAEFHPPRLQPVEELRGTAAWLKLSVFGYSFPAGLAVVLVGAALLGDATRGRAALLGLAGALGVATMSLVPRLFGAAPSPTYFGAGGVAILVLFLLSSWFWARRRRELPEQARGATDLQGVGYLCFALAAWNACGSGGMPGWAIYPERVSAAGTQMFAVGQLKAVMAFFVLGWLFTALGMHAARRRER